MGELGRGILITRGRTDQDQSEGDGSGEGDLVALGNASSRLSAEELEHKKRNFSVLTDGRDT
jgi:hypothetical protein